MEPAYFGASRASVGVAAATHATITEERRQQQQQQQQHLPPREARAGFVWRLLPNGSWFEKRKRAGRRRRAQMSSSLSRSFDSPDGHMRSPTTGGHASEDGLESLTSDDRFSCRTSILSSSTRSRPLMKVTGTGDSRRSASEATEKKGLYGLSKQFLKELRQSGGRSSTAEQPVVSDSDSNKSRTRNLLEQTTSLLQIVIKQAERGSSNSGGVGGVGRGVGGGGGGGGGYMSTATTARRSTASTQSSLSTGSRTSSSRRLHKLLRRNGTVMSKSSSVLDMLMGKPPASTPSEDALYAGTRGNDYFKVEISDPDGPTFLPSEARRIGTPPLPSDRPRKGRLRGFFFDYGSPGGLPFADLVAPSSSSASGGGGNSGSGQPDNDNGGAGVGGGGGGGGDGGSGPQPRPRINRSATVDSDDWFHFRYGGLGGARDSEPAFELNVPEHLPGSPLCPRSPLHKSGGKGICVYHGRSRTLPLET
jgi:parafibromin